MAGTSLELAANNLTQIEKLGGKTKVHLLAVLKPSSEELRQKTPLFAPEVFYREITYPLGTGFQPNLQKSNSIPITAANGTTPIPRAVGNRQNRQAFNEPGDQSSAYPRQHLLPAETTELSTQSLTNPVGGARDAFSPGSSVTQEQDTSTQLNQNSNPREPCARPSTVPPRDRQDTISPAGVAAQQSDNPIRENERPREILSARDSRATRTFAILKMLNRGDNPWDLGSVRLNLETVMGNGIVDWLLPIRRSPCCNHEDAESQFRVGPKVDFLRASCYFIEPNEVRLPKKIRKESERIERAVNQPASDPSLNGPHAVPMGHLSNNSQSQQG
jgi:palmitoyltransferase